MNIPPVTKPIPPGSRAIVLTHGYFALVDEGDYERCSAHVWCVSMTRKRRTAKAMVSDKLVSLHRFLMDPPHGMVVDHVNGQPLDCRRENLRVCTMLENLRAFKTPKKGASSRFRGVFKRSNGKWAARFSVTRGFENDREAAEWYNQMAASHYGAYAQLNVLDGVNSGAPTAPPDADFFNPAWLILSAQRRTRKSGFRGVHWHKHSERWRAVLRVGGIMRRLGNFRTSEEAAKAHDAEATKVYGDGAILNFPNMVTINSPEEGK